MKQRITVHGRDVTFYPRELDTKFVTVTAPTRKQAVALARAIDRARPAKTIDDETPLAAALATWAWWGTGKLDAHSTWETNYRPKMLQLMDLSGGVVMAGLDEDWYDRLHQRMLADGWTAEGMAAMATMFGSFGTWTQTTACPWQGPRPGGALRTATHTTYRALARANHRTTAHKIRLQHCPSFDEAIAFGETLGALAVKWWGKDYAGWKHLPIVQIVTGCRFNELFVLRADQFSPPTDDTPASVDIHWQYRNGVHTPGNPNVAPTKNRSSRTAVIWDWAHEEYLVPVLEAARARPGELLFPIPPDLATGKRRAQDLYKQARERHGYRYTSHWHRKTYITRNIAPRPHGLGLSAIDIIGWVGHSTPKLILDNYWMPTNPGGATAERPKEWR